MRRSKSNPAKYARNYRKISQRRMTEETDDPLPEIERLKAFLQESKDEEDSEPTEKSKEEPPEKSTTSDSVVLSEELKESYGESVEEIILPSKKRKAPKATVTKVQLTPAELKAARKHRKQAARKLEQLQKRAEQKEKRQNLYQKLQESAVSRPDLLQKSATLGKRKSKKEHLKEILQRERAGITLESSERDLLYRKLSPTDDEPSGIPPPQKKIRGTSSVNNPIPLESSERKATSDSPQTNEQTVVNPTETAEMSNLSAAQMLLSSLTTLKMNTTSSSSTKEKVSIEEELNQERLNAPKYKPEAPVTIRTTQSYERKPAVRPANIPLTVGNERQITRPDDVIACRATLPVVAMELEVMDSIHSNDVTIVSAETGSGKSTQVPQFLLAKFSQVAITQPRRVAAISVAKRVAYELGIPKITNSCTVAYQTRYESAGYNADTTKLKFMTDGILLQEIKNDLLLRNYNAIVLDEAHERNLNTDVLIGLLQLSLRVRKQSELPNLKVVIMSATLRVKDFTNVFPNAGVVQIPGRTHSVTIHHAKHTELDRYEDVVFQKTCKIHRKLPPGGLLVFLTGKQEIIRMAQRLERALNKGNAASKRWNHSQPRMEEDGDAARDMDDDEIDGDLYDDAEVDGIESRIDSSMLEGGGEAGALKAHILPLYSMMPSEEQAKVFATVPDNHRLIVLATNIAETSLTIPGINYVVDSGRQKSRNYHNGVSSFDTMWISKAAADQRAGRAGRTGPGQCYRIYSSSLYTRHMDQYDTPEVLARPLEDVVLAMKAMKIDNIAGFPFPTPPDREQVDVALSLLANIGCLDQTKDHVDGEITRLGMAVSKLPLGVRHAKLLLVAAEAGLLDFAIALVAILSENHGVFLLDREKSQNESKETMTGTIAKSDVDNEVTKTTTTSPWLHKDGDLIAALLAVGAYTYSGRGVGGASEKLDCRRFCKENCLNPIVMERIQTMRKHLAKVAKQRLGAVEGVASRTGGILWSASPPNLKQTRLLCQSIAASLLDNIAQLAPPGSLSGDHPYSLRLAYIGCTSSTKEPLFMDRNSVLFTRDYRQLPRWVCYQSLERKCLKDGRSVAIMKQLTPIDPSWLSFLAKGSKLLAIGDPIQAPPPSYNADEDMITCSMKTKYGYHGWEVPSIEHPMATAVSAAKGKGVFTEDDLFRWFGRFLLEGKIFTELTEIESMLNDPPSVITRKISSSKVIELVSALSRHGIMNKHSLIQHWTNVNDKFLFSLMKKWVRPEQAPQFKKVWIRLVESVTR